MKLFTRFRNAILVLGLVMVTFGQISAQNVRYSDSWSHQGFTLVDSKSNHIRVDFSVEQFSMVPIEVKGNSMVSLEMPGVFLPGDEGAPNLPGQGRFIAIPSGATPVLRIVNSRVEVIQNVEVAPAPRIPLESEDSPLEYTKNSAIYSANEFYPAEPVKLSEVSSVRGVDFVTLGITPFQYNPVTKELRVIRDLEVAIDLVGGNGEFGDVAYRNRYWDPMLSDILLNYSSLPRIDYKSRYEHNANRKAEGECEYMIITPDGPEFQAWADTIRKFRTEQGVITKVFTITEIGGNSTNAIQEFIKNAYNNWTLKPVACLLLGDHGSDGNKNILSKIYDNYCVSDNLYSDVNGDMMPDVVMSRITANNNDQLTVMITKFLNYERNPPTAEYFYQHPITALGWQTERWFQICSEVVGGYFKKIQNKEPVRINKVYQGTPGSVWSTATNTNTVVNYFGPNGLGYIPQSPAELGGWDGGNATMINEAINAGSFLLQHRDHGEETGWGEPSYHNSNINALTNTDLTFIMSINCLTGKYNWSSECFTEKFHRHTKNGQNAGALGLIGASEVSYSFVNDTYVWGVYDNWFTDFMPDYGSTPEPRGILPSFGNAAGKYFLKQSNWPYNTTNKAVTYNLFHHHGESFSIIYSEVPQAMVVDHDTAVFAGSTSFDVTATEGATVCVTVDGEIMGVQTAGASAMQFTFPAVTVGQKVVIVATMTNHYRYRKEIVVTDNVLTAAFQADQTNYCETAVVNFTDMSTANPQAWEWTFEGGSPATSTERNPQGITYSTPGQYNVTLKVTKGTEVNEITLPAYIVVTAYPVAPVVTSAGVCVGQENTTLVAEGANVRWYSDEALTNMVGEGNTYVSKETLPGVYTYYVTATNDICQSAASTATFTIAEYPVVTFSAVAPVCITTAAFTFGEVTPAGGVFEGNGIVENMFNPSVAGAGTHTIKYIYTNETGCSDTAEQAVTVIAVPDVTLSQIASICENGTPFTLTGGLPEGGVYSGLGVANGDFDPSVVGAGSASVTYTYTDPTTGCLNEAASNFEIYPKPVSGLVADTTICHNWTITLDGTVEGATYAWSTGATTATISIDSTGIGLQGSKEITLTLTSDKGCVNTQTALVEVQNCTGVNELAGLTSLEIYPNPVSDNLNIKMETILRTDVKIEVINSYGVKVYQSPSYTVEGAFNTSFSVNDLPSGAYFIMVKTNDKTITRKIVVRK